MKVEEQPSRETNEGDEPEMEGGRKYTQIQHVYLCESILCNTVPCPMNIHNKVVFFFKEMLMAIWLRS